MNSGYARVSTGEQLLDLQRSVTTLIDEDLRQLALNVTRLRGEASGSAHLPPTQDDMRCYQELGIPLRVNSPEARRRASCISLFDTLPHARTVAAGPPWYGTGFIAELRIPTGAPVTVERTGRHRGHHTPWGAPDVILSYTARVLPIRSEEEAR